MSNASICVVTERGLQAAKEAVGRGAPAADRPGHTCRFVPPRGPGLESQAYRTVKQGGYIYMTENLTQGISGLTPLLLHLP